jgi:peptidyl-prolyl cis-trans isomerase B (cyclophilin B)
MRRSAPVPGVRTGLFLAIALLAAGVSTAPAAAAPSAKPAPGSASKAGASSASTAPAPAAAPSNQKPPKLEDVAVIKTDMGEIAFRFFPEEAPGHVAFVKELIKRRFYDGTTFHRVIPHFVAQGGDPNSKNADRSDDGDGEADRRLKAEFSKTLHYRPGTVGMARDTDPDSGSCQFFIALENLPRLDGKYTIFGEVISGLEVARAMSNLPRDLNDNPILPVKMTVTLEARWVPEKVLSRETVASPADDPPGETVTGPVKPRPFDPRNSLWKAPVLKDGNRFYRTFGPDGSTPVTYRMDVVVDADGSVIDARFPDVNTPPASPLRWHAIHWAFQPALYDGKPQKARIAIDSDGKNIGPPKGGGSPEEIDAAMTPPVGEVTLMLPAGKRAPASPPRLRLIVDEAGAVADAALQGSTGDPAIDAAVVEAAMKTVFKPATRPPAKNAPPSKDGKPPQPEPVRVYLDAVAQCVEGGGTAK